jgi:hypothetical protein
MRKPARPAPAPTIATAERLERVRTHTGIPSQRAFWQRVAEGWDDAPSYEAVRTYHFNREAPAAYLARVAYVFPEIRLEWLVTGEGEMTDAEQKRRTATEVRTDVGADLRRRIPDLNDLPYTISLAVLHHLDLWDRDQAIRRPADETPTDSLDYAEGDLWPAVTSPLHGRRPADFVAYAEYIIAALHARNLALLLDTYDPHAPDQED